jgi:signal peptidase I
VKADATQAKNKIAAEKEAHIPMGARVKSEIIAWFWVALAFLLINGTLGQARVIPSASMENTLLIGDHLIMSRVGYGAGIPFTGVHASLWKNPVRQQLVIFKSVVPGSTDDIIKRVIGLPGETIDIHDNAVWINGRRLQENYTQGLTERVGRTDVKLPLVVADHSYFVMGDNREDSYDSRFVGCVPRKNIIGTPVMIYMSLDAPEGAWESGSPFDRILAYANAIRHPGTVRWKRLFETF